MISAPLAKNEEERLKALLDYKILDTDAEQVFDDITQLASFICGTPISLVSLVDMNRQWFKSKVGLDASETPREVAFCAHALLQDELFVIPDSFKDERFKDNPLATDAPHVRFYAGMPLKTPSGYNIGTLCVIDDKPRDLSPEQRDALKKLAHQVISQMELRHNMKNIAKISKDRELLLQSLDLKNKELDQFAYIVSHDLKAPLRGISNLATWIKEDVGEDWQEDTNHNYDLLQARVNRLENLIEGILNYSRSGKVEQSSEDVDLNPLIEEVWGCLPHPEGSQLQLEQLPKLHTSPLILQQIFQNILSNSVKYSDKENVCVTIKSKTTDDAVEITIKDNGPGIDEQYRNKVFEVFQTLQARDTFESTGVGLSIVLKLIKQTGGEVWISGSQGEGASFHLKWPKNILV